MKIWKILVMMPYALAAAWTVFWLWLAAGGQTGWAGVFIIPIFVLYGIEAAVLYTIVLSTALLIRWLAKRRKR